ncbi:2OG-Fe(II) oxygenase [Phaeocystidibacter luteus]|uniref:2OG-Fe(II) oxygenase n=1 Tax=Phaeocystidibacter luteus TaxID=911197 RepID=A0A6N6RFW0_9FLAO|nr:2OG-Fe(II) oxygenase [Phaeocystidibacter luteus]KAB2806831.1 2OG-Fe(II) oxygenase [Phaeocystidibacter luteus]
MTAHPLFNRIAEGLSADGWFTVPGFVSREDAIAIRDEAVSLREEGEFRRAGIGKQGEFQYDKSIRGDEIHWVDESEAISPVKEYLNRIADLQDYLNQTCFLGLRDFESHFAVYPVGTRYARHADRFKNNPHRIVSSVLYLNPDWEEADGGQLVIYQEDGKEVSILPEAGKLVCFRSELEHEVLPCNRARYSMTGWFLDQPLGLTFL